MTLPLSKRSVVFLSAAVAAAVIAAIAAFLLRRPELVMPHIPAPDDIEEMKASMNGRLVELPVTDFFVVPKEFYARICGFFKEAPRRWESLKGDQPPDYRLGRLHFWTRKGQELELAFYTAGKGVIGFSVGHNYYLADTVNSDGGTALLFLLDEARQAAGVPRVPYPPPIERDDNIKSMVVSAINRGPQEPEIVRHNILPVGEIPRIMRFLQGPPQPVAEPWPLAQQLGVIDLVLKDGTPVSVRYFQSPRAVIRFSVNGSNYRVTTLQDFSSDSLDREIRGVIQYERLMRK